MPAQLAILVCSVGIVVLFYLNRDKSVRNSRALWVPVIWLGLTGSRPVSMWFGMTPPNTPSANLQGSPLDAAVFGTLVATGVTVLLVRREKTSRYLAAIVPIIVYSIYCLISIAWSPIPHPALKRWVKDVGDVAMTLIICTETQPLQAVRQLYSRVGLILFPFSIVLIRYTTLGRARIKAVICRSSA